MDASIVLYTPFNEDLTDKALLPAIASDSSDTPWSQLSIATGQAKFGAGHLELVAVDYDLGGRGDSYAAFLEYPLDSPLDLTEFTVHCWMKFPTCPGIFWDVTPWMRFTSSGTWDLYPSIHDPAETRNHRGYDANLRFYLGEVQGSVYYDLPLSDNTDEVDFNWLYNSATWHHLAVTVTNGRGYAFFDGNLIHDAAVVNPGTQNSVSSYFSLDSPWVDYWYSGGYYVHVYITQSWGKGLLDELIVSSTPLWTTSFTPPVSELGDSSVQSATKLILHMNGSDESTTFEDSSTEQHDVVAHGTAQMDASSYVLGNASGLFASGDNLTIPDDSYWSIFNSDWTIHFRFRLPTVSQISYTLFEQVVSAVTFMRCTYDAVLHTLTFNVKVDNTDKVLMSADANFTADTWYHIALTASAWEQV